MKFFKPQVQLAKETVFDEPDVFYLHVVTFCPRTNFRADGHSVSDADLAEGIYNVTINLVQDTALPDFDYITPVVHTIALGSIAFPEAEGWIQVQVIGDVPDESSSAARGDTNPPTTTTKTGGTGTVSTSDADNKSRPYDSESL